MGHATPSCARRRSNVILAGTPHAAAQTLYGSLVGNVTDASGASVPSARVQVADTTAGFTRATTTDERGAFLLADLPPGSYEVRITAPSFAGFTKTALSVTANTVVRVDVQLQLAGVAETITVAAAATILQTDRAEVRTEISSRQLREVPIPEGRNYQSLFRLIPGNNVSNLRVLPDGTPDLRGFAEITSAQNDERQFRFGLRISF